MAGKKSLRGKGTYAAYKMENRVAKNKRRKLERHLKRHPNDGQAESAVATSGTYKGRSAPKRINSRKGIQYDVVITKGKNGKTNTSLVNRGVNRSNGRLSSGGRFEQQMMKMKKSVSNVYQFLQKNKKQLVGDEVVDSVLAPVPTVSSGKPKRVRKGKRKARKQQKRS
tara:strand:- start:33385 stop:33888 length:504 start_codon:yes stop_codon:yes gene_type:complete